MQRQANTCLQYFAAQSADSHIQGAQVGACAQRHQFFTQQLTVGVAQQADEASPFDFSQVDTHTAGRQKRPASV
ncbi:hypothetical protein D3C81_2287930 [compost metagenome]